MLMTVLEWSDWRNATVLWVHSVFVRPEARRRGVFRALYEHLRLVVEHSPELAGLRLYVDRRNETAKRVYESLRHEQRALRTVRVAQGGRLRLIR